MDIETTGAETVEATPIGTETVETPQETVETETPELGTDESTEVDADQPEGEQVEAVATPDKFKGLIENLKKTDPALAKEVKNLVFAADALKKEFPGGLPELRQMKTAIDELGGAEGIEGIKAEKAEWAQIDEKFANGDPSVLDEFAKFNPEGFAKLIPSALDKLAGVDKETYDHTLSGIFVATLDSWRFIDNLERMAEKLSVIVDDKGNRLCEPEIQRLQQLAKAYEGLKTVASKAPVKKTDDPTAKIAQERAEVAKERAQITFQYVGQNTEAHATKKIAEFLPGEAKNHKFNLDGLKKVDLGDGLTAYDKFNREINDEVARLIKQDAAAVKKISDSVAAGRKEEAAKLSNAKFDQIYQTAVRRVVKLWASTFNPKPTAAKATPGAAPTPTGVKKLEKQPDPSVLDQKDPGWRQQYMWGKGKLKSGQRVEW